MNKAVCAYSERKDISLEGSTPIMVRIHDSSFSDSRYSKTTWPVQSFLSMTSESKHIWSLKYGVNKQLRTHPSLEKHSSHYLDYFINDGSGLRHDLRECPVSEPILPPLRQNHLRQQTFGSHYPECEKGFVSQVP